MDTSVSVLVVMWYASIIAEKIFFVNLSAGFREKMQKAVDYFVIFGYHIRGACTA
jgi:hypothetical protein